MLLTAHSTGIEADWLEGAFREGFPTLARRVGARPLEIDAESGVTLRLGTAIGAPR